MSNVYYLKHKDPECISETPRIETILGIKNPVALAVWLYCWTLPEDNLPTKLQLRNLIRKQFNVSCAMAMEAINYLESFVLIYFDIEDGLRDIDQKLVQVLNYTPSWLFDN